MNPFIPGIESYCDRWCERCRMSHRCRVFAQELRQERLLEEEPTGDALLNRIQRCLDTGADDVPSPFPPCPAEPGADDSNPIRLLDGRRDEEALESNPLVKLGTRYGARVGKWLEAAAADLESTARSQEKRLESGETGHGAARDAVAFEDALETIGWYRFQIGLKLRRALAGQLGEPAAAGAEPEGCGKVALVGIDRSLVAWNRLGVDMPRQKEAVEAMTSRLEQLRKATEQAIPGAREFERPGLDAAVD